MLSAAVHLIPYALIATLSPLGFAATITVMRTGRLKAIGFALGVVLGQLLACAVLVAVGAIATPDRSKSLLATVLVWLPVLGYVLLGNRAMTTLDAAGEWLSRHRRPATVYILVVVGVALLVSGVHLL